MSNGKDDRQEGGLPLLQLCGVGKNFALPHGGCARAVADVDLTIGRQEVVGLVGESGSGKTTLGRMVVGLLERNAGEIRFDGETLPTRWNRALHRRLGPRLQMIFQDPSSALNPRMRVGEIIAEPLRLLRPDRVMDLAERVDHALQQVGLLPEHRHRYPHEFSGGQRQRIGIARALMTEPQLLVCDEPISALDLSVQAQIINLLSRLKESHQLAMLFIAHDLSMVRYLSDRVVVLYRGVVVEEGKSQALFANPLHPYTQSLIASCPLPDPLKERARQRANLRGEIAPAIDAHEECPFATRCPRVQDRCRQATPRLEGFPDDADPLRRVACFLVGDRIG